MRRQLETRFGENLVRVSMTRVQTKNMWEVIVSFRKGYRKMNGQFHGSFSTKKNMGLIISPRGGVNKNLRKNLRKIPNRGRGVGKKQAGTDLCQAKTSLG